MLLYFNNVRCFENFFTTNTYKNTKKHLIIVPDVKFVPSVEQSSDICDTTLYSKTFIIIHTNLSCLYKQTKLVQQNGIE